MVDEYKEMPIPETHPTVSIPDTPGGEPEAEPKPRDATGHPNNHDHRLQTKNKTKHGKNEVEAKQAKSGVDRLFKLHNVLPMLFLAALILV